MILADANSEWNLVATLILAGAALAGQITMWISMKGSQKREVTFAGTPVDKSEFEKALAKNEADHKTIFSVIGEEDAKAEARARHRIDTFETAITHQIKEMDTNATVSRRGLHRDVDEIGKEVASLKTAVAFNNQQNVHIENKLDRLIEKDKEKKIMTPEQRELFRETILRSFRSMRTGMKLGSLRISLASCGFMDFTDDELLSDIQYFVDKGFLQDIAKSHSVAVKLWRITAQGIDDLERRGI